MRTMQKIITNEIHPLHRIFILPLCLWHKLPLLVPVTFGSLRLRAAASITAPGHFPMSRPSKSRIPQPSFCRIPDNQFYLFLSKSPFQCAALFSFNIITEYHVFILLLYSWHMPPELVPVTFGSHSSSNQDAGSVTDHSATHKPGKLPYTQDLLFHTLGKY